uniref:(northern house mosquito) hypothetical protein n=1 Tax=Culex pipiens TaxID=7175 RepID=A0A8D8E6Q0_CULPI
MSTVRRTWRSWKMLGGLGRNATLALEPHLLGGGGENGGVVKILTGLGGARRPREPPAIYRATERALPGRSWRVERSLPLRRHELLPAGGRRCWVVAGDRRKLCIEHGVLLLNRQPRICVLPLLLLL